MLTRKQKAREKRNNLAKEMMVYFDQAFDALVVQCPKEAIGTALDRAQSRIYAMIKKDPKEKMFFLDVLIDVREQVKSKSTEMQARAEKVLRDRRSKRKESQ